MRKKILIVFGTRPEVIKMAPLVKQLEKDVVNFRIKICATAQHREMLDEALNMFHITPNYDLNIMKQGQDLYDITLNVLLGMRGVLSDFEPDIVLVHGDTTTTAATALSAFYQKIKVGHVEAGLRTNNLYSPWPEEANRQITSVLADYHFVPTKINKENLLKENKDIGTMLVTGNTVIDALYLTLDRINCNNKLECKIIENIEKLINNSKFKIQNSKFILVTNHRRENHGKGFIGICLALKYIAQNNPDIDIIYPVHLNPNIQKVAIQILSGINNIYLIEPLNYESFVYLMKKSYFIITDSGGIQEEAPSLGKPVLVTRDVTERPEAVEAGTVKMVGTSVKKIIQESNTLLNNAQYYKAMSEIRNPYGDGKSCVKIAKFLKDLYLIK